MTTQPSPGESCEQIAEGFSGLRHRYQAAGSAQTGEQHQAMQINKAVRTIFMVSDSSSAEYNPSDS